MKTLTIKDIRDLKPCYDPGRYLSEDWTGTVVDILELEDVLAEDRIWVALRLMPRFEVECFAIDCAFSATSYATADAAAYATAYATTAYAAAAADAAAYATTAAAAAAAYAYATTARKKERENQIDALIMLMEGKND